MTATVEDRAAAVRAIKTIMEAKKLAARGLGVDDLVVRLKMSREQARRIVFGERKS